MNQGMPRCGPAPVRRFLPDLISRVRDGRIDPGKVFDLTLPLDGARTAANPPGPVLRQNSFILQALAAQHAREPLCVRVRPRRPDPGS